MLKTTPLRCGISKFFVSTPELNFSDGEICFLIGPNGAGKTTLLKTLAGIIEPLEGKVQSSERPAFLPARSDVDSALTVEEVAQLFLPSERSLSTVWDIPGHRFFSQLSSGEQKRILIETSLNQGRRNIVLDEPLNFLDWQHALELQSKFETLLSKGHCFVVASHDLHWALRFKRAQALMLDQGQVVASGPMEEVLSSTKVQEAFKFRATFADNPIDGSRLLALASRK